ncbi:MAG: iron-containing alcohol dehydrogenase [Planctomycetaceae bacterium]|nr:iron-containing alcohol dehydrogenase [Planctomycetaceae bacterium]
MPDTSASRCYFNFHSAGRLVFGSGSVKHLASFLAPWSPRKVFVLSDRVLEQAGVVAQVLEPLQAAGLNLRVCLDGEPEPTFAVADKVLAAARDFGPDAIIAVGGGSNMDLAKITACILTHGGSYRDYVNFGKVPGPVLPLICLPTTSGTGSEVSHAAVLTDQANHIKVSILSHYLRPAVAVVDPMLTLSCPAKPTADSGIDALTHAIETFTATAYDQMEVPVTEPFPYDGKHPLGDMCAEKAIALIGQHLVTAVREPNNLAAREGMSLAATLAGLAFSNGAVAVVHALEYPLGGAVHVSHGAGNGLLLPYVMRFNLPTRTKETARIAALLGEDTTGVTDAVAVERAITAVERLRAAIGIPNQLRELGVTRDQLPTFAAKAFGIKRLMLLNGRRPTEADLLGILEAAW